MVRLLNPPTPRTPPPTKSSVLVDDQEKRVSEEIEQLLKDIRRIGPSHPSPAPHVLFGELFEDEFVEQYYEALVGTLKSAKKRGIIKFKGQILLKGMHDNVLISIVDESPPPPIKLPSSGRPEEEGGSSVVEDSGAAAATRNASIIQRRSQESNGSTAKLPKSSRKSVNKRNSSSPAVDNSLTPSKTRMSASESLPLSNDINDGTQQQARKGTDDRETKQPTAFTFSPEDIKSYDQTKPKAIPTAPPRRSWNRSSSVSSAGGPSTPLTQSEDALSVNAVQQDRSDGENLAARESTGAAASDLRNVGDGDGGQASIHRNKRTEAALPKPYGRKKADCAADSVAAAKGVLPQGTQSHSSDVFGGGGVIKSKGKAQAGSRNENVKNVPKKTEAVRPRDQTATAEVTGGVSATSAKMNVQMYRSMSQPVGMPRHGTSSDVVDENKHTASAGIAFQSRRIAEQQTKRVDSEIEQLLVDIRRVGAYPGEPHVTFGELFDDDDVANHYEGLVGTLRSAKKRGLVNYKGQMLLKGMHDKVMIEIIGNG